MPSSRGAGFRKLCRWLHRDLSFFFAGMVLIYALSGLFMNHRNDIDRVLRSSYVMFKIRERYGK